MELAPNEVIISPADYLNTYSFTGGEHEFTGFSFSQTEPSQTSSKPSKLQHKNSIYTNDNFPWKYLPMINVEFLVSSYARVKSIELIQRMLSSRHLDKQQKFVIENTIISPLYIDSRYTVSNILLRHLLTVLIVLATWLFNFYLFLTVLSLTSLYLIQQIFKQQFDLIFRINRTFTKVYEELNNFEKLVDELSIALKLLKQIQIVEKATFNVRTIPQNKTYNLTKLKHFMTDLYSSMFFDLQNKTFSLPIQDLHFHSDELICTIERDEIYNRVYDEVPVNVPELSVTKMSLDSFNIWHCLLTCQYGEYFQILVGIIDRNLQFQYSLKWLTQEMEIIQKFDVPNFNATLNSLSNLISFVKLDLFALNLKDRNISKEFCPRKESKIDSLDKIDYILQCCILKIRNLKELDNNDSVPEFRCLKFSLENAIEGIETIGKLSSSISTQLNTTIDEIEVNIPHNINEREIIIPKSNPLEVPASDEIIFEGVSHDKADINKNNIFLEKEEYINTGAARTVLKELKCVLANKQILKTDENQTKSNTSPIKEVIPDTSCIAKIQSFQPNAAQNLLNFAILNSSQNLKLSQTVIGDNSDSD
ncbi:hypothetical protein LOD99_4553 [Oopsacas minuta]|uniref:Vezatin n=1 Tax=Oopsacas minuta TaxID=111878 RepID=A0AAV7JSZ2_9METZ|nr:hypothetical protein LOD99_4553 [Oopsacas minuta]